MTTDLFAELYRRGVRLRLADGKLHVTAPPGALTPALREEMSLRKDELIEIISRAERADEPAGIQARPAERHEPFPLTDIQQAYWVGRTPAVELGGNAAHGYLEFDAVDLDVRRLGRALNKLIRRHDMLRAVIQPGGYQQVLPDVPEYGIAVADLSELDDAAREAGIEAIRAELSAQIIPADRWPLFEVRATKLDGRRWRLHMSFDMLIMDGFSIGIFQRDWFTFYSRPDAELEPLDVSFRDHVLAEKARQQGGRGFEEDKRYWLDRLDQLPAAPELPLAVQPGQLSRPAFARQHTRLSADHWSAIKETARSKGLTPAAVLLAAYADVLRRWSKRPELTLNLTLFNRPPSHPRLGEVIGDFTSVVLLESRPESEDSFADRAKRLHHQLMEDLGHSSFSGVRVLRERARRLGGRPGAAMPVVFTSMIGFDSCVEHHRVGADVRRRRVRREPDTPSLAGLPGPRGAGGAPGQLGLRGRALPRRHGGGDVCRAPRVSGAARQKPGRLGPDGARGAARGAGPGTLPGQRHRGADPGADALRPGRGAGRADSRRGRRDHRRRRAQLPRARRRRLPAGARAAGERCEA